MKINNTNIFSFFTNKFSINIKIGNDKKFFKKEPTISHL